MNDRVPPDQLGLKFPPAIRAMILRQYAVDIRQAVDIEKTLSESDGKKRLVALNAMLRYTNELTKPYEDEARLIELSISQNLLAAQDFERAGDIDKAIEHFDLCIRDGFTGSLPYDRLRILYTRKNEFDRAIRACERYIEILGFIKDFNPKYPNVKQISTMENWIEKLKIKQAK